MADNSAIEWTEATWNFLTGCTKVSPGCDNCYMFAQYPRLSRMKVRGYYASPGLVQIVRERLDIPFTWKRPRRIFVNSMSDLFHPAVPFDLINDAFYVMTKLAPWHEYQVLTKRPGRAVGWWEQEGKERLGDWPGQVWMGTSVENQKYAPRLTVLNRIPAPYRFVSAEPLLGPLDLREWIDDLSWVIVGGESGSNARPMALEWAEDIQELCQQAGVPFYLKQLGGFPKKRGGELAVLNGQRYTEYPKPVKQLAMSV